MIVNCAIDELFEQVKEELIECENQLFKKKTLINDLFV